jgi:hypothetical protein
MSSNENASIPVSASAADDRMPKVAWDEAGASTHYANIGSVMGRREEMVLVFGNADTWKQGADQVTVKVAARVVMNPFTMKRFYLILKQGIEQYERRFGEIKLD